MFAVERQRFAISLGSVVRVLPAAAVTLVPGAPAGVMGVVDVHGEIIPVIDLRHQLCRPSFPLRVDDQFLIVRSRRRTLALRVDETVGVLEYSCQDLVDLPELDADAPHARAALRLDDGLILIQDVEAVLSADELDLLDEALGHPS
ncbi:MAG: chemotaxis protein CheW [Burkholderiaceae bacterium]